MVFRISLDLDSDFVTVTLWDASAIKIREPGNPEFGTHPGRQKTGRKSNLFSKSRFFEFTGTNAFFKNSKHGYRGGYPARSFPSYQRPTDQDCRKSAVELVPGKSTASSKAAVDLRAPCGGLQSTLRAGGGRTRARSAALEGSSAPAFHRLPAGRVSGAAAARRRRGMGDGVGRCRVQHTSPAGAEGDQAEAGGVGEDAVRGGLH